MSDCVPKLTDELTHSMSFMSLKRKLPQNSPVKSSKKQTSSHNGSPASAKPFVIERGNLVDTRSLLIRFIDHIDQRYETCGDWEVGAEGYHKISVSRVQPLKYSYLVAVHELIEMLLCMERGIPQYIVDDWDIAFEKKRLRFPRKMKDAEPGDNPAAPYFKEHQFASKIEKMLAKELKINWREYEEAISSLSK